MLQFFYLASYLWTACFAFHLNQLIVKNRGDAERHEMYYHLVSWGAPGLICLYLLVRQQMGSNEMGVADRPWCWITTWGDEWAWDNAGVIQQFAFFYVPLLIIFVYNCIGELSK